MRSAPDRGVARGGLVVVRALGHRQGWRGGTRCKYYGPLRIPRYVVPSRSANAAVPTFERMRTALRPPFASSARPAVTVFQTRTPCMRTAT